MTNQDLVNEKTTATDVATRRERFGVWFRKVSDLSYWPLKFPDNVEPASVDQTQVDTTKDAIPEPNNTTNNLDKTITGGES